MMDQTVKTRDTLLGIALTFFATLIFFSVGFKVMQGRQPWLNDHLFLTLVGFGKLLLTCFFIFSVRPSEINITDGGGIIKTGIILLAIYFFLSIFEILAILTLWQHIPEWNVVYFKVWFSYHQVFTWSIAITLAFCLALQMGIVFKNNAVWTFNTSLLIMIVAVISYSLFYTNII